LLIAETVVEEARSSPLGSRRHDVNLADAIISG